MPIPSEEKHQELVNEILRPKNPMSRGGSHVTVEHSARTPNVAYAAAVPKSRYLSNQRLSSLPEINEARAEEEQKGKAPIQDEEFMQLKRDRDYIRRALKEQSEGKKERSQSLKWDADANRVARKMSLP